MISLLLAAIVWGGAAPALPRAPGWAPDAEGSRWLRAAERVGETLLELRREDGLLSDPTRPNEARNLASQAEVCRAFFALARSLELPEFAEAGDRCLLGLSPFLQPVPGRPGAVALVTRRQARAGVSGLAILAVAERTAPAGDAAFLPAARALGWFLLSLRSQDGSFRAVSMAFPDSAKLPGGEPWDAGRVLSALLALQRLDGIAGGGEGDPWDEALREGLGWVLGIRDLGKSFDQLPFDPWLMEALDELHRREGGGRTYFLHARRLAAGILRALERPEERPPAGRALSLPRATVALAAMVRLAKREGEGAPEARKALGELAGDLARRVEASEDLGGVEERAFIIRGLLVAARIEGESSAPQRP